MSQTRTVESAAVATFDRGTRGLPRILSGWTFTIVLMVVFFLVMMMCLTAGVSMYRSVTTMQAQEDAQRMQSGLMTSIVRMNDTADAVAIAPGPQGDALVLVEHLESGTYETRLYRSGSAIMQEYAIAGRDLNPENAIAVMDSETFEFSYADGLLTLVTDQGASQVALRSVQDEPTLASAGFDAVAGDASANDQAASANESAGDAS